MEAVAAVAIAAELGDTTAEHATRCILLGNEVYALLTGAHSLTWRSLGPRCRPRLHESVSGGKTCPDLSVLCVAAFLVVCECTRILLRVASGVDDSDSCVSRDGLRAALPFAGQADHARRRSQPRRLHDGDARRALRGERFRSERLRERGRAVALLGPVAAMGSWRSGSRCSPFRGEGVGRGPRRAFDGAHARGAPLRGVSSVEWEWYRPHPA